MRKKIYVSIAAVLAIAVFEFYMCYQVANSNPSLPKCYPTGEIFPYKDRYGNIKYDSVYHTIADFKLKDQNGKIFTNNLLKDKIYVANFFFVTCPSICPRMTHQMARIQKAFKNNTAVALLSHTIDPEHDSVEVLKRYEQQNKMDGNQWHLLTGLRRELYNLSKRSYYLGVANDSPDSFEHSEKFVLVDNHRIIRGYYNGTDSTEVAKLMADMRILLKEMEMEK